MRSRTETLLALLPFAVMGIVAVVDVMAGPDVGFLALVALGPALAAVWGSVRRAVTVGLIAMLLCTLLASYNHLLGSRRHYVALAGAAGTTVAGVVASAGRQRKQRELANVRLVAEVAQRVLLRPVPRRAGPIQIAGRYISAAAEAQIGGDLYEVIHTPDGSIRVIIGDVKGKGLEAVEIAAAVLGAFRQHAFDAPDLSSLADRVETSLARSITEEEFVTAVLLEVHHDLDKIDTLNCGHPPPLLLRGTGGAEFLNVEEAGAPLGLGGLAGPFRPTFATRLLPRDRILLYTDGISEARSPDGRFYPLAERLDLLSGWDLEDALDRLREDVLQHVGSELDDDVALLLIQRIHD